MDKNFMVMVAIAILVFFSNLGGNSIYILDEAKNAACAMEMMQRGDPVVPTFNGVLRTDKPPLHYYFMIASYSVFGVTAFAARFFSAVCGVFLLIVVYQNVKRLLDERTAIFSSLALLSSSQLAVQFHMAVPDPFLILFMTIALFSFYRGYHHDPKKLKWFYMACSLGFLAKGLIAVVLPALIIFPYLLITGNLRWSLFNRLKMIQGLVIFCLVALPWYVAVGVATNGEWLRGFFLEHNLERYTSTMEGHRGFPLLPFFVVLVALLPFSVFVVQAVRMGLQDWKKNTFLMFCLIVCVVIAGFFSMSRTILPSYPAPAFPFLAVLLGNYLARLQSLSDRKGVMISTVVSFILGLLLIGAGFFMLDQEPQLKEIKNISWIFLALPLGTGLGWFYFKKGNVTAMVYSWSISWIVVTMLFFYWAYPRLDKRNPVVESLPLILAPDSGNAVISYRSFNPAYIFNLKHTVEVVNTPEELNAFLRQGKTLVITKSSYLQEISADSTLRVVYRGKDLFERGETVLLSN